MRIFPFALIVTFFLCLGCKDRTRYVPEGLRLLEHQELMDRARSEQFPDPNKVVYKRQDGEIVPPNEVSSLDFVKYTTDPYVDESGIVRELVLRIATDADRVLYKQLQEAYEEGPAPKIRDVDCAKMASLLQGVYDERQENLNVDGNLTKAMQKGHLEMVLSIGASCGMPNLSVVNEQQMGAIWMTISQSSYQFRKAFLPNLVVAVENGDIEERNIAAIKDKIMMDEGKPQIYGTQVYRDDQGNWKLYGVEEPEYVDRRREDIGFGNLQEYLAPYKITFEVEQY
ncbi:MAG: hypothetical protein ACI9FN_001311 [Saprospiraceae bacterium]|jgi:hypothetical protein